MQTQSLPLWWRPEGLKLGRVTGLVTPETQLPGGLERREMSETHKIAVPGSHGYSMSQ